jgi:hypothetical protein
MKWAALITWVVTALGGFTLLGVWLRHGGFAQRGLPGTRIRPPLLFGHALLAASGLVLWIVYTADEKETLAWIAFGLLAAVAALGFTMFAIWIQRRMTATKAPAAVAHAGEPPGPAVPAAQSPGPTGAVAQSAAPAVAAAPPSAEPAVAAAQSPGSAVAERQPAELHFPVPVVAAHGLVAAATLVLVLLTAAGVGGS